MEVYGLTNPGFDVKYLNIWIWSNENADHWYTHCS